MRDRMTRRQALLVGGAATATALGGIAVTTQEATATVDVSGSFSVADGKTVLADQQLQDVRLSVDAYWEFSANADVHATELELLVGASESTLDLIARQEKTDLAKQSLTGEAALNGSLMSASDFDIADFQPTNGELRRSVIAALRFYAVRNGEVLADAEQITTFDVVVSSEELQVDITMGGSGEVEFQTG